MLYPMTVAVETPLTEITATGLTSAFNVGFSFEDDPDLQVTVQFGADDPVSQILGAHYTVAGDPLAGSGQVVFASAFRPPAGAVVRILRQTSIEQAASFGNLAAFKPKYAEAAFDRMTRVLQEIWRLANINWKGDKGEKGDPGGNVMAVGLFSALSGVSVPSGTDLVQTSGYTLPGVGAAQYAATSNTGATPYRAQTANGRWFELIADTVNVRAFGAIGDGVFDDTDAINEAISYASARGIALGHKVAVEIPSGAYLTDGVLMKSRVWLHGPATLKKRVDGGSPSTNSILRCIETLNGATYYGVYYDMRISGLTFDANGKVFASALVRLAFVEDVELESLTVIHSAGNAQWAFLLAGHRIKARGLKVLGGAELFQDGVHIAQGHDIQVSQIYVASGDDAVALGSEPTDPYLGAEQEDLFNVEVSDAAVLSQRGAALKVYVQSGWTKEIYKVRVSGLIGASGVLRNGGVVMQEKNLPATGSSRIHDIDVAGVNIDVGSDAHTGVNPYGIWLQSIDHVSIEGVIRCTSGLSVSPFRLVMVTAGGPVRLAVRCPSVPANGAMRAENCTVKLDSCHWTCGASLNAAAIITQSTQLTWIDTFLLEVPNNRDGLVGTVSLPTDMFLKGGQIAHVSGATSGFAINGTASTYGLIDWSDLDLSSCPTAFAGGSIAAKPDYNVRNIKGAATRITGMAVIPAGDTSVDVDVSGALDIPISTIRRIGLSSAGDSGAAVSCWATLPGASLIRLNCDAPPGGAGWQLRYEVDTSKSPLA